MHVTRRPRATRALLALGLVCALLGPGPAARAVSTGGTGAAEAGGA